MTFVLISVACFVSIILAMRWQSRKQKLRLHLEIQRLLSVFHLVLAAAVPVDMHHSMQISDFNFFYFLHYFKKLVTTKKSQYITKVRKNKTTNYTSHQR